MPNPKGNGRVGIIYEKRKYCMALLTCPKCGLFSDHDAINCDCGYNFQTKKQDRPLDPKYIATHEEKLTPLEMIGFFWLLIIPFGIIVYIYLYIKYRKSQPNKAVQLIFIFLAALVLGVLATLARHH